MADQHGITPEQFDALCSAWPEVTIKTQWEVDRVASVASRMFAVLCLIGPERGRVSFPVDPEHFVELSEQPGMGVAPYTGRAFWISVVEPERFTRAQLERMLREAYDRVRVSVPKKSRGGFSGQRRG